MAGNTTTLDALLTKLFKPAFINETDNDTYMLRKFGRMSISGDGERRKVRYGSNDSIDSYAELDTLGDAGEQSYVEAFWPIYQYKALAQVSGLIEAQTQGTGGYMRAFTSESRGALENLKTRINDDIMRETKTNTTDMDGLPQILLDTGTYAGIDRATYTFWQSYLNDAGTDRDITIALMQDMMQNLADRPRKAKINLILTDYAQFDNYGNLLTGQRRFRPTETLDGAVMTIDFQGIPIARVPGYTSNRMDFLQKNTLKYASLLDFKAEDQDAGNVDAKRILYKTYGNLHCYQPSVNGALTDLNTTVTA